MRRSRTLASALVLLVLAAAPRPSAAAWPHDPDNGNVPVCLVSGDQSSPASVSDGAGGVIIAWQDHRSGSPNIYAQHISAAGVPQWAAGGVALCTAAGDQLAPVIVSDNSGGAIVTWFDLRGGTDYDVYAQCIDWTGATLWTDDGVVLCTAPGDQTYPTILPDGAGGAFVAWQDMRNLVDDDIYAQRVNKEGLAVWTANGVALCVAPSYQDGPRLASDGAGGAFVTWYDSRSGSSYNIYAQRLSEAGTPQWTANGVAVSTAAVVQIHPELVSNGAGGAIIAWADLRDGYNYDIYAQAITASGVTQWTAGGVSLCSAAGDQYSPTIASDGAGGAIVAWQDSRTFIQSHIYAQRISAAGATRWGADGTALCTVAGDQLNPRTVSDGAGGAIVAWQDTRTTTNHDIYAQRITGAGTPQWTWDGVALCTAVNNQQAPAITSDGAGGAIVTWQDQRNGNFDIYAQRIERFGWLGSPEPKIVNVKDYPNDQGGKVRIKWEASYLDADPYSAVVDYYVWRQAPPFAAEAALKGGAARLLGEGENPAKAGRPVYRITQASSGPYYWEYVTSQMAQGFPGYSFVTTTGSDSVGAGNPPTRFMIEAVAGYYSVPMAHWDSSPDSGYSVDNLPPGTPAPFTGQYAAGTTHLHWNRNTEADLAGYRLYRGHSESFIPAAENLVGALPDTGYADVAGSPYVYKLTAVDAHGNESHVATLVLGGTLEVNATPAALSFAPPSPNPVRGATTLAYTLSRSGHVRLAVYDAAGRRVTVLRDGEETAGAHGGSFALRDAAGRELASGLYLLQLEAEGQVITRRLAAIR